MCVLWHCGRRTVSPDALAQMEREVAAMERQHEQVASKWQASKERIRRISHEIVQLHTALQRAA